MIIPPAPTAPRSPMRRAMRLAGVVAAPVLLVAAVAVGLAGPKPEPPAPPPSIAPPAIPATDPLPRPMPTPDLADGTAGPPAAPASFAGLNAVAPSEAIAQRAGGHSGPLVIRGELKLTGATDGSCDGGALGPLGPWCTRTGILADRDWAATSADFDPLSAHLHVTLPLGVRAPDAILRMAVATAGPPLPVVVVGRFTGSRCNPADLSWCEEPFVVDRVIWADGVRAALTPLAEDRLASVRRRPNPFQLAVADRQTPLLAVLAWPQTITRLDPATADRLALVEASIPVWYLRVLEGEGQGPSSHGGRPAVHWYLLDERLLTVIATGGTGAAADPASVPPSRTADAGIPAVVAGLGVHSVADAMIAAARGQVRPIAVAGRLRDVGPEGICAGGGGPTGTWCPRIGRLHPYGGQDAGGPAITVRIPPGVRIPDATAGTGATPEPVVVVGVLQPAKEPCAVGSGCEPQVRAERIAAAADTGGDIRPAVDRDVGATARRTAGPAREQAEGWAAGSSGAILGSALVLRDRLGAIDPAASKAVRALVNRQRPLWYVTALQRDYGSRVYSPGDIKPRILWVVVDATSGRLLASGVR